VPVSKESSSRGALFLLLAEQSGRKGQFMLKVTAST
jgi:hypothetical protein